MKTKPVLASNKTLRWLLLSLVCAVMFVAGNKAAHAQQSGMTVFISRPAEGEAYYSGPTSLMYSIPISGWVTGYEVDPAEISIQLEVLQDGMVVVEAETWLNPDGTFLFYANVNETAPEPRFMPEQGACGLACHVAGSVILPGGALTVRITAMTADGHSGFDEVDFWVDHSVRVSVPVEVILVGDSAAPLLGIPVQASTRLYLWRTRVAMGSTGLDGEGQIWVESLSEAPTEYLFEIRPAVIGGIYYEGIEPVVVTLQPGGSIAEPVRLRVVTQLGGILGQMDFPSGRLLPLTEITAVSLSDGSRYTVGISSDGSFVLRDIPIDRYLLMFDGELMEQAGLWGMYRTVDLFDDFQTEADLSFSSMPSDRVSGTVYGQDNTWLPFVWLQTADGLTSARNLPRDGRFSLYGWSDETETITVVAPGYYSQQVGPNLDGNEAEIILAAQPETRTMVWGAGQIVIPSNVHVRVDGSTLYLDNGWLWGEGGEDEPLRIIVSGFSIEISQGRFALELLPDKSEWLYLFEGEAVIRSRTTGEEMAIGEYSMVNLAPDHALVQFDYDPRIAAALTPLASVPISLTWKPTLLTQVQEWFKNLGVHAAQILTIITYSIGFLSLIVSPILLYIQWRKEKLNIEKHY